ncbi:hypothetical protein [Micromonospora aurantiaca (nom. illeg.)]|uniref:hypothetical protein n=1 Tax=Micromonospora aurantiaca (nom. illeg.) TaxID=47850 RepID=UPI00343FF77C
MAATIPQIMTGIETRLKTVHGLNTADHAPGNPMPPAAFPLVPAIPYRETMGRAHYTLTFRVVLLVANQLDRVGQHLLAEFASQTGDRSIRAALEGDRETTGVQTLGGLVHDLVVDGFDPDGLVDAGLAGYIGGIFTVRIMASGV